MRVGRVLRDASAVGRGRRHLDPSYWPTVPLLQPDEDRDRLPKPAQA